ncbi:potassium channel family protein [Geomicrobium sediminis]|uniref:Trk system potassium uptake protein TrkA n=1 Tax=Geomicrobium sediminis TaxID=1347788 RepID=A0ABS2PCR1_9BACL|nr:TrkA family potassium uptake protein [Geomicrobium sediminis]MBM7633219.1 trk system potassium uptake protein TrkA [Geomicrobium sediminis]
MRKEFVVIGLGRFGLSVARTLIQNGHDVLAIDQNEQVVQEISSDATYAVQIDATDEAALEQLGIHKYTHAIVGIGEDLKASILVTLLLKELQVGTITAKAKDEHHGKVLSKIGADHVIFPEMDMGKRLGNLLSSNNLIDYLELSKEYNIEEVRAPKGLNQCLVKDVNHNKKYNCTIIAIKNQQGEVNISPNDTTMIKENDVLMIVGKHDAIEKIHHDFEKHAR